MKMAPYTESRTENESPFFQTVTNSFVFLAVTEMFKTFKKLSQRAGLASVFLICVALLSGCATLGFKQPEPVTVGQVIQMTKEGVPAQAIVQRMRDSGNVYRLTAAQLAELHDLGVADPVLDYMQQTYIEAERRQQRMDDRGDWGMLGPGFW
jgi:hypothetical protein